jgi:hypothetical protein
MSQEIKNHTNHWVVSIITIIHGNLTISMVIQRWVCHGFIKIDVWVELLMFTHSNHMAIQRNT